MPSEASLQASAKKSLGQNFLIHTPTLDAIADAVPVKGRTILEVGPGYGALTERLVARDPSRIVLVELDERLVRHLELRVETEWHASRDRIGIHSGDILQYVPNFSQPYDVIANIPYYITSPILFRFLWELPNAPEYMVVLMQREVADKILAEDGKHSLISVALGSRCRSIRRLCHVPAEYFRPAPKVDSSVLVFEVDPTSAPDKPLLDLLKRAFSQPRKKLASNLANDRHPKTRLEEIFVMMGLPPDVRAERLELAAWRTLLAKLAE